MMISEPLTVRPFGSTTSVRNQSLSALKSVVSDPETEWVLIAPERQADRQITPADLHLQEFDLIWSGSDPLLRWFWNHTSVQLVACLGATAPILIRASKLHTESVRQDLPQDLALLMALAQSNSRFGVDETVLTSERVVQDLILLSPIPERESAAPPGLKEVLSQLAVSDLVPDAKSSVDAKAVKSGVLLIHDFLELSHSISQSIEGEGIHRNGDYWHAMMHRREPDFGNSKYWFRRVGTHPVFSELRSYALSLSARSNSEEICSRVDRITAGGWDPFAGVDFFEEMHETERQGSELHRFAEQLQMVEMLLLLRKSWRDAMQVED